MYMGLGAWKPVFMGLWTTKAQTSLHICTVWSVPLIFVYWKVTYLDWLQANFFIYLLASLCSWTGCFESHFVGNLEDEFSGIAAHIV